MGERHEAVDAGSPQDRRKETQWGGRPEQDAVAAVFLDH
jgi:hypothetical protein